jgi:hypothetical protein
MCCANTFAATLLSPARDGLIKIRAVKPLQTQQGAVFLATRPAGFLPSTANTQRLVARQPELWPQHFTFLSAVAADSSVTCSHVMTDRAKLAGRPLYLVLGDYAGRLYFFTQQGHLMHEYDTGTAVPPCSSR